MAPSKRLVPSPRTLTPLLVFLACLVAASATHAVDGVLEINQACVASGCFPGDGPGFPVEITEAGSYRLTSNLQVPDGNTDGIVAETGSVNVSIDLNGFTISGTTDCSTFPCSNAGGGIGIKAGTDVIMSVRAGHVRNMGGDGVSIDGATRVEGVSAVGNGGRGIYVVTGNILNCYSRGNGDVGIRILVGSISQSTVVGNHGHGIETDGVARSNKVIENQGHGMSVGSNAVIIGNAITDNGQFGLFEAGPPADAVFGYANNVIRGNNGGDSNPQVQYGIEIGTNVCGTDTNCP
jgi:hypothetical protein